MTAQSVTDRVLSALARTNDPYMVVGSFSSNAYGPPRSTKDMDLVMQVNGDEIGRFIERLGEGFSRGQQIGFETKFFTTKHKIHATESAFDIEVFELSDDPHDRARFDRRLRVEVSGHDIWIASAEDVIIQKLRWGRRKDLDDVRGILAMQGPSIDREYLEHWCNSHGTLSLLNDLDTPPPGSGG